MMAAKPVSVILGGVSVPVTNEVVKVDSVKLNPDNPRIRFLLQQRGVKGGAQDAILDVLRAQPGYDSLQKVIRKAGGIYDPLIVSHDGMVVEGNTRAAVYKFLKKGNPTDSRWKTVPIRRLPKTVAPKATALLMASYHIGGKNQWRAYAKADQIYYLKKVLGFESEQIADETRMTVKEVDQNIAAYEYLVQEVLPAAKGLKGVDADKVLQGKFHHALEFIKNKELDGHRKDPKVRKQLAQAIAKDEIKGQEVRHYHKVIKNKKAAAAMRTGGFQAAKVHLKGVDPVENMGIFKKIAKMTKALSAMSQPDLEALKTTAKAKALLVALHLEVKSVASYAKISLKG
jgi:hypothetical protein